MPSAFKRGLEESLYNKNCFRFRKKPSGQGTYIGIIVRPGKPSYLFIPAYGRTNFLMLVACHVDTVARPADCNPIIKISPFNSLGKRMGIIRIINAVFRKTSEILYFIPVLDEPSHQLLLQPETGMV